MFCKLFLFYVYYTSMSQKCKLCPWEVYGSQYAFNRLNHEQRESLEEFPNQAGVKLIAYLSYFLPVLPQPQRNEHLISKQTVLYCPGKRRERQPFNPRQNGPVVLQCLCWINMCPWFQRGKHVNHWHRRGECRILK